VICLLWGCGDWLVSGLMELANTGFVYGQSETNKVNGIKLQCYGGNGQRNANQTCSKFKALI
jgi:hypothetical protein